MSHISKFYWKLRENICSHPMYLPATNDHLLMHLVGSWWFEYLEYWIHAIAYVIQVIQFWKTDSTSGHEVVLRACTISKMSILYATHKLYRCFWNSFVEFHLQKYSKCVTVCMMLSLKVLLTAVFDNCGLCSKFQASKWPHMWTVNLFLARVNRGMVYIQVSSIATEKVTMQVVDWLEY